MDVPPVDPAHRLRIAVLADFEGPHARAWLRWFIARGHDVHAVSFYPPSAPVAGATMHALRPARTLRAGASSMPPPAERSRLRGAVRLAHAARYRAAGLRRVVRDIAPDVFHAHFLVEHAYYGLAAGVRPYVVTAWGSDVLVEPQRDPISRWIACRVARTADLVTSNNAYMADRIVDLGATRERVAVITLGAERYDLERAADSVNRREPEPVRRPVILSTRAHEPLYNIDTVIDAYTRAVASHPGLRLVVAHGGLLAEQLRARAARVGGDITFTGFLDREALRDAFADAEVFVSVPSSDATSVAVLQAMAAGALPIVSDLPTQREWIEDGVNGLRVPPRDAAALAGAIQRALADPALRRRAADANREIVEQRGLNEVHMAALEARYLRLAGRS